MRLSSLSVVIFSLGFFGCSQHPMNPTIAMTPPSYVEAIPSKEGDPVAPHSGSLFGQGENPLFSDRKAMRVNDIVRVVISESTVASSSGAKKLAETQASALGGGVTTSTGGNPIAKQVSTLVNGVTNLGYTSNSTSSYQGTGTNDRKENFTTTISARVIKVMNNGTYFIHGSRELLIDGEKQIIEVSGVVRGDDIDKNNMIGSAYISDAKISYKTEGDVKRASEQGWFTKGIEAIWPF